MKHPGRDDEVRVAVIRRAQDCCEVRGASCTRQIDGFHHRYRHGRVDTEANLLAVCDSCHTLGPDAIHRNIATAFDSGTLIRSSGQLPTEVWSRPTP